MRKTILFSVILVALFLVACSTSTTTTQPTPQAPSANDQNVPPPPPPPAPSADTAKPQATAPQSGSEKAFGTVDVATALNVDDVRCDKAAQKITFRFKNIDEQKRTWNMNQGLGWNAPKDQVNLQVFINNYEANRPSGYMVDGVRQFGPSQKFSDNCGGKETLAYGEDATCTLTPVPLKSATAIAQGNNEILISALPSSKHIIQFLCP